MMLKNKDLSSVANYTFEAIRQANEKTRNVLSVEEFGVVQSYSNGIAWITGLPDAQMDELVRFPGNKLGIVFNIEEQRTGVVLLDNYSGFRAGDEVHRSGRVVDIPVGENLIGRVIDPTGKALDSKGPLINTKRMPIEREAPHILDRAPVKVPLQTGIKVIDALIPIGRGQRQLIIGDRQTGKTAIAIDTIINQRGNGVICVYCAIGQRGSSLVKSIAELSDRGAMDYTVVVIAEGGDVPGKIYIAPYAATSIAEYFMEQGKDVLIVYDDLTTHANTYREISLLLRRPPGREAFPGDIFYIHSRLLERATHLRDENAGGSLTALPIIQTQAQNISAYIPTNLISITDGQIYLSPDLFQKGVLPAVDVGKSVSRVGGKAQLSAYHAIAGNLKLAYSQFEELEMFSRFGTRLDEKTRKTLSHGQRIRACLKQAQYKHLAVQEQIALLIALSAGLFDEIPLEKMSEAEEVVIEATSHIPQEINDRLIGGDSLSEADNEVVLQLLKKYLQKVEASDGSNIRGHTTEDKTR